MGESKVFQRTFDTENEITLGVLNAVHDNRAPNQRSLARELDIALGLANGYLKRCVKKGFIKITQAPANRYAYYLTPKGFSEKSRLTAEYLTQSFSLFRQARLQYADMIEHCVHRGWTRIALRGCGDLCEIAALCAHKHEVTLLGIIDPDAHESTSLDLRVVACADDLGPLDAVILTDMRDPHRAFEGAVAETSADRVLIPKLLGLSPSNTFRGDRG